MDRQGSMRSMFLPHALQELQCTSSLDLSAKSVRTDEFIRERVVVGGKYARVLVSNPAQQRFLFYPHLVNVRFTWEKKKSSLPFAVLI